TKNSDESKYSMSMLIIPFLLFVLVLIESFALIFFTELILPVDFNSSLLISFFVMVLRPLLYNKILVINSLSLPVQSEILAHSLQIRPVEKTSLKKVLKYK